MYFWREWAKTVFSFRQDVENCNRHQEEFGSVLSGNKVYHEKKTEDKFQVTRDLFTLHEVGEIGEGDEKSMAAVKATKV